MGVLSGRSPRSNAFAARERAAEDNTQATATLRPRVRGKSSTAVTAHVEPA